MSLSERDFPELDGEPAPRMGIGAAIVVHVFVVIVYALGAAVFIRIFL
jgi:hypothetical protein